MNRRCFLTGAAPLAVAGCGSLADLPTRIAVDGALVVQTIASAAATWAAMKGGVQIAIAGVSLLNPALGASLAAGVLVGDGLLAALPTVAADTTALAEGIAVLVQHGAALFTAAAPKVQVVSNGVPA